jgi:acyl-coenzyme A synthetase/AMP-(fatty) acid ligase
MNNIVGVNRAPWCYYIEEELPRNTMGKIERQKLTKKLHVHIESERTRYF